VSKWVTEWLGELLTGWINESHTVSPYFLFSFSLNSTITIQFLHYNIIRPLFLAIIRYYSTFSTLSATSPQLANVYNGGISCYCLQNRFLLVHSVDFLLADINIVTGPFISCYLCNFTTTLWTNKISPVLYWKHEIKTYEFCAEKRDSFFRVRIYGEITKRDVMWIVVILQCAGTGSVGVGVNNRTQHRGTEPLRAQNFFIPLRGSNVPVATSH
jgi:hypothetical protein